MLLEKLSNSDLTFTRGGRALYINWLGLFRPILALIIVTGMVLLVLRYRRSSSH